MKGLSPKARIALGLVGLMVSLVLIAATLDLIPDRKGAMREGRAALAELLAVNTSIWIEENDLQRAESTLGLAVERNADLLSAAVREKSGGYLAQFAGHESDWIPMQGRYSNDSQILVPLLAAGKRWGDLELRFTPLSSPGVLGMLSHPLALLAGFMALAGFFGFYFYLSKVLAQLDPSNAIPARVRSALDSMAEGLLVIDKNGRVVLANRAFAALVGRDADDLAGTKPHDFNWEIDAALEDAPEMPWTIALRAGGERRDEMVYLRDANEARRALKVNCSPVLGTSGRPAGVLVSFDDVTQLEAQGEELREAKVEADEANRAKSEFLANMSHEIRTPMNAIMGFTDVLRRGYDQDDATSRKYLNTIHSSGKHLLELINDILDLSKVEAGNLEVENVRFAPHQIAREVIRVLGVKAREKNIGLEFSAEGMLPETILSDPTRFRQILTNLIGNAIKFTDEGSVRLVARLVQAPGVSQLEVDVIDSGIGIAQDKLEAVFNPFEQADSSVVRRFGGTGLGLPISRRFARAMNGDISVNSMPGQGSTFTVRLDTGPLLGVQMMDAEDFDIDLDDEAVEQHGERRWHFAPARVLVVDDAPENRALLEVLLFDAGLEMDQAEHGQQALDMMALKRYDIVLMDMQMPVMDGYTATRRIREQGLDVPVVALTAHAMAGFEEECTLAGCSAYVTKPIDIDVLFDTINRWLEGEARETEAKSQPDASADAQHPAASAEPITSRLGGDARVQPIIALFVGRLKTQFEAAKRSAEEGDLAAVADFAHWLKGSGGTVGFDAFTEPATLLERLAKSRDESGTRAALRALALLAERVRAPEVVAAAPVRPPKNDAPQVMAVDSAALATPALDGAAASAEPICSRLTADPRLGRVVAGFVSRLAERLAELHAACDAGDFQKVAELAHWLKGSAGSMGFNAFTDPAYELECLAKNGDQQAVARAVQVVRGMAMRVEGFDSQPLTAASA